MGNYNCYLIKAVLFDAFIMYQFMKLFKTGEFNFENYVFITTVSKYTLYIFYGFVSILFNFINIRATWNELSIIRCKSKKSWACLTIKNTLILHGITTVIAVFLIVLNALLFRIKIFISLTLLSYFAILFLYMVLLNLITLLFMSVTRNPELSVGISAVVNIIFLVVGHKMLDMENQYAAFLASIVIIALILSVLCFSFMNTRDIYTNRNASHIFEK